MGEKWSTLILLLIFCIVAPTLSLPLVIATEDSWTTLEPMPTARSGLGVAVVNGKIYAIGGSTAKGFMPSIPGAAVLGNNDIDEIVGTNEEYDPSTDTWSFKTLMLTPRIVFAAVVYQNKVYCIGGKTNDGYTAVNEVYDPITETWEVKTSMPTARGWLTANVVDNKIYVINGNSNQVYDPATDSWATRTPSPKDADFIGGCASAVFDDKIIVIGGLSQDQHYTLNQIYDTKTDTWSDGTSPLAGVMGGAAATTTGDLAFKKIYVVSGGVAFYPGAPLNSTQVYDPEKDNWTIATNAPTDRYNFGVVVINDRLYVIGGHIYNVLGFFGPSAVNEQYTLNGYIPEFPSWIILPLFLIATLVVTVYLKKLQRRENIIPKTK